MANDTIKNNNYMNHDVFISYSGQDMEAAQAICHVLEQNEIRCWMAPRNIPPGSDYGDVIDDAIKSCKVVVIAYSKKAASSRWVTGELNVAFEEQKTIIPFRLDKTPLRGQTRVMLNQRHWIDAYPDYKTKFNDLVGAVALAVGKDVQLETPPIKPSVQFKKYKKLIIFGLIAAIAIGVITILYPFIIRKMHIYVYDKQGLFVKVKGLSVQQEKALTSILDDMVLVEGGTFIMGNADYMETYLTDQDSLSRNPHKVDISNYYISKCEVTQMQWEAFSELDGHYIERGADRAIDILSWNDAKTFSKTLADVTGLNFSLPTEAQWEYAARGGIKWETFKYIFSGGSFPDDIHRVGWTMDDNISSAQIVKSGKDRNNLGLYDMTGNVSEWCLDYFAPYDTSSVKDPSGPQEGYNRIFRGGDFLMENMFNLKTTTRYHTAPFTPRKATGIRLVINMKN